jgi:citrate lyase subunit beta/citryl-CoA lyase
MLPIRTALVLASRVAGIAPPIDGVTTTLLDDAAVVADAVHARTLGFGGKLCIHPRQVAAVNQAFNPSDDEIAWALGIVAAAESSDGGVVTTADGQMVDMPVIGRARQLLALLDRDLTKELRNAACARR